MRKFLFFDTETTGLPHRAGGPDDIIHGRTHSSNGYPKAVQLSWLVCDETGTLISKGNELIRAVGFTMPEKASSVNGITDSMLESHGSDFALVADAFIADASQCSAVVAHNADYDLGVMEGMLDDSASFNASALLTSLPVYDTMKDTIAWFGHPQNKFPKLVELHRRLFGTDFSGAHDAFNDTVATKDCFFELVRLGVIKIN